MSTFSLARLAGLIRPLSGLAAAAVLFVATACTGSDGGTGLEGDAELGSFSVTVTGDAEMTASGEGVFHSTGAQGSWSATITSPEISMAIVSGSGRPATGTHQLAGSGEDGAFGDGETGVSLQFQQGQIDFSGESVSGTLTIDSSTADRVSGSFLFNAVSTAGEQIQVTVTGTFTAVTPGPTGS